MNVNVDITVRDENDNIIMSQENVLLNTTTENCFNDDSYTIENLNMCLKFMYPIAMRRINE